MFYHKKMCRWLSVALLSAPLISFAAIPITSMVVFGDSLSDTGNTTHLLKSLRQEENPSFFVYPFKKFVINKMVDFADEYYVPQMVLDAGLDMVTNFFDYEVGPYIANLVGKVRLVPVLPGQPYWKYRFSNGRVWNEYLAQMWGVQMGESDSYLNMSFGGGWAATYDYQLTVWNLIRHPLSTIKTLIVGKLIPPSIGIAVQTYLLDYQQLSEDTVYFIYAGNNDYINVLKFEDNYNPAVMSTYVDNVLDGLSSAIFKLQEAGARRFVIMGIPYLGETPKFVQTMDRDVLNAAVIQHNERLKLRVEEWSHRYEDTDFLFIDTAQYLTRALTRPEQYGFSNTRDACIDVKLPMFNAFTNSPFAGNYVLQYAQVLQYQDKNFAPGEKNYHVCNNPESYLFWDEIHPNTRAHHYLAIEVCNAMKDHGYAVACEAPDRV